MPCVRLTKQKSKTHHTFPVTQLFFLSVQRIRTKRGERQFREKLELLLCESAPTMQVVLECGSKRFRRNAKRARTFLRMASVGSHEYTNVYRYRLLPSCSTATKRNVRGRIKTVSLSFRASGCKGRPAAVGVLVRYSDHRKLPTPNTLLVGVS